jgi:integrase
MPGRQAKVIAPAMLRALHRHVQTSATPDRDWAMVLLSVKAGLRAAEIAKLDWSMIICGNGQVGLMIELPDRIAKWRGGRRIPLHPDLRLVLARLWAGAGALEDPVILSGRGGALKPNSVVNWFVTTFAALGLRGCSSHSGRRTFITKAARAVHKVGGSLRDVQLLAGHRSIETTQRYIDGDSDAQRRLVALI